MNPNKIAAAAVVILLICSLAPAHGAKKSLHHRTPKRKSVRASKSKPAVSSQPSWSDFKTAKTPEPVESPAQREQVAAESRRQFGIIFAAADPAHRSLTKYEPGRTPDEIKVYLGRRVTSAGADFLKAYCDSIRKSWRDMRPFADRDKATVDFYDEAGFPLPF